NSTGLQNMVREVRWYGLSQTTQETLNRVSIISPRATASDLSLLSSPGLEAQGPIGKSVAELLESSIEKDPNDPRCGLHFTRTIAPDDSVLNKLIAELARRRIPVVPQTTPDGRLVSKPAHVAILSEWDTPYGRLLGATFAAQASGQSVNEVMEQPEKLPPWI